MGQQADSNKYELPKYFSVFIAFTYLQQRRHCDEYFQSYFIAQCTKLNAQCSKLMANKCKYIQSLGNMYIQMDISNMHTAPIQGW